MLSDAGRTGTHPQRCSGLVGAETGSYPEQHDLAHVLGKHLEQLAGRLHVAQRDGMVLRRWRVVDLFGQLVDRLRVAGEGALRVGHLA